MSKDIESRLRRAYLANGGTETGFEASKGELIAQYRNQATITVALEEANRKPTMNDLIRGQLQESRNDDGIQRLFASQKGTSNAA